LQWPIVILLFTLFFRNELTKLMGRLQTGKFFGAEISLKEELDELEAGIDKADPLVAGGEERAAVNRQTQSENDSSPEDVFQRQWEGAFAIEREVINTAAESPSAGLMLLASYIESTLRAIAANRDLSTQSARSASQLARILASNGGLPLLTFENVRRFWGIRNEVAHNRYRDNQEILRAIESGLLILRSLEFTAQQESLGREAM
jgi:hypothetical protein